MAEAMLCHYHDGFHCMAEKMGSHCPEYIICLLLSLLELQTHLAGLKTFFSKTKKLNIIVLIENKYIYRESGKI